MADYTGEKIDNWTCFITALPLDLGEDPPAAAKGKESVSQGAMSARSLHSSFRLARSEGRWSSWWHTTLCMRFRSVDKCLDMLGEVNEAKLGMGREQGQSEGFRSLRILNLNLAFQIII